MSSNHPCVSKKGTEFARGLISLLVKKNITSKSCKCRKRLTSSPALCPRGWGAVISINWWISKIFI